MSTQQAAYYYLVSKTLYFGFFHRHMAAHSCATGTAGQKNTFLFRIQVQHTMTF